MVWAEWDLGWGFDQVCRHDIEGGFGEPGFGGVVYLEVCTVVSVL